MKNNKSEPSPTETASLALARSGDQQAFAQLIEPYRHELLVHSYRFLASFEDAEDVLQETLLRAWRRLDSFEGRSTFRAWLYKIATNASLDALDGRNRRATPVELYPQSDPLAALPQPSRTMNWVGPFPDTLIDRQPAIYPEARYEVRESITLAFVAALQHLPGRQRAVLLLRDVLGWNINDIAEILIMTPKAVNSILQRARITIQQHWNRRDHQPGSLSDDIKASLLDRYLAAWEAADSNALVALFQEDIALTMPPLPVWYAGCQDIQTFLDEILFKQLAGSRLRLVATRANGSPAFAAYLSDADGIYHPAALHVLTLKDGLITEINDYLTFDDQLFSQFGLPLSA